MANTSLISRFHTQPFKVASFPPAVDGSVEFVASTVGHAESGDYA